MAQKKKNMTYFYKCKIEMVNFISRISRNGTFKRTVLYTKGSKKQRPKRSWLVVQLVRNTFLKRPLRLNGLVIPSGGGVPKGLDAAFRKRPKIQLQLRMVVNFFLVKMILLLVEVLKTFQDDTDTLYFSLHYENTSVGFKIIFHFHYHVSFGH